MKKKVFDLYPSLVGLGGWESRVGDSDEEDDDSESLTPRRSEKGVLLSS